jgi:hypothetical protein
MNKIPSVFMRNPENMNELLETPHPDALWVLAGEGVATRKYDGTCVMLDEDGKWWARREVKPGKEAPPNWKPTGVDDITGKAMGWEPIEQSGFKEFHIYAVHHAGAFHTFTPGTYELCAPRIGRNPENLELPKLFKHSEAETTTFGGREYTYGVLKAMVVGIHEMLGWEGIVWHHPDGRMAKLKGRDFK